MFSKSHNIRVRRLWGIIQPLLSSVHSQKNQHTALDIRNGKLFIASVPVSIRPFNAAAKSTDQPVRQTEFFKTGIFIFIESQANNQDSTAKSAIAIFFTFLILAYIWRYIRRIRLRKRAKKNLEDEFDSWPVSQKSDSFPVATALILQKSADDEPTIREAKIPPAPIIPLNIRQAEAFPKVDFSLIASPAKIIVPPIRPAEELRRLEKKPPVKIKTPAFPPLKMTETEELIIKKDSPETNFVIVEGRIKDEVPHAKPASILYFPNPNNDGNLRQADGSAVFKEGASIYKFKLVSVNEAKFEFCAQRSSITMALANRGALILSVAEELNVYDPNASQILTHSPGTANFDGAVWSVKTKVKIRYV